RTWTSSRWALAARTPPSGRQRTPGRSTACPAAHLPARQRRSPPAWPTTRSARTPAARSGSRLRFPASSDRSPPMGGRRGTAVRQAVTGAINQLASLGAEVDWEVSLPSTGHALAVYYIIAPSEASANLARYDGVKYGYAYTEGKTMWEDMEKTRQHGFGDEVKRRIMLGTYALSAGYYDAYYLKAQKVRTLI